MRRFLSNRSGFTLVELLVVMGILAILLTIVLIAINPARQFSQANNTKRRSDVAAILNAINQYASDNRGALPAGITTTVQTISNTAANICAAMVPRYLAALPTDPSLNTPAGISNCAVAYSTGYNVVQSATDNRVTLSAPSAELGETILVTR